MRGGVFVCHASQDAAVAQQVVAALERADVPCWIAPRDIEPGEEYTQAILEGLEAAPAVVLVFSGATNESPHVRRELEATVGSDVSIIPVRVEAVEPSRSLRYFIGTAQWLEAVGSVPEQWEEPLVRGVRRALEKGEQRSAGTTPTSREGPLPRSGRGVATFDPPLAGAGAGRRGGPHGRGRSRRRGPAGHWRRGRRVGRPVDQPVEQPASPSSSEAETTTAPTSSAPPPDEAEVVFEDTFDGASTALQTGPQDMGEGRLFRDLVNGAYVVRVTGIPEGNKAWTTVGAPGLDDGWSVSVDVVSQAQHGCGVMVGQGEHELSVVLDRATGLGEIMWFTDRAFVDQAQFAAVPGDEGRLSLSRDGDRLVVRVGEAEAARLPPPRVASPTVVGVAVVGADNTCVFDNFRVTR